MPSKRKHTQPLAPDEDEVEEIAPGTQEGPPNTNRTQKKAKYDGLTDEEILGESKLQTMFNLQKLMNTP